MSWATKSWLGAIAFLSSMAPAQAQLAGGLSGQDGVTYMGQEETFYFIRQMGNCFVQRRQADAERLLATRPNSSQETAIVRALLGRGTNCIPNNSRLSLPRDAIRGAVAEAMYRRIYITPPPEEPVAAAAPANLNDFSRCVVRRHPQEVHDLVTTTWLGTREEQQAIVRMTPVLRQCLPNARNPRFAAPYLRLALAEALYNRAREARSPR